MREDGIFHWEWKRAKKKSIALFSFRVLNNMLNVELSNLALAVIWIFVAEFRV